MQRGLEATVGTLEQIKKTHRLQVALRSEIIRPLKAYIGKPFGTPTKPKGKMSRIINPVKRGESSLTGEETGQETEEEDDQW